MKIVKKIRELVGPQGPTGVSNKMPVPDLPEPRYGDASSPLMGSIPRPGILSGTAAAPFEFPNDADPRRPVYQQPKATTSPDTAYSQQPRDHTELPSGLMSPYTTGPDPRLPTQAKIFGEPTLYTVPPRVGRLQLTSRKQTDK